MQEIAFSIPVSGTIRIEENSITITVTKAETTITFEPETKKPERLSLPKGQTLYDIVLESARDLIRATQQTRFTAIELYREAVKKHSNLNKRSWTGHVIASAPNHPSYQHHAARRDYFKYLGEGSYQLDPKYLSTTAKGSREG